MKELCGKIFGRLTVVRKASSKRTGCIDWECVCSCGSIRVLSSDHLTRKTNPVKSCGCLQKERIGAAHSQWNGVGGISGGWWCTHVERERKQSTRPKVPVTLTKEEAWKLYEEQGGLCALSGVPIVIASSSHNNTASIDRIDSSGGYELGNVQWVHKHVNFMKRTYSQEYFIDMCTKVANNNAGGACDII